MKIRVQLLSTEAFASYGEVVAPRGEGRSANAGMARRFDEAVVLENRHPGARANLAVFDVRPYSLPFTIQELEQHPHSSQTFLPLQAARYAVVVCAAQADGAPDVGTMQAFIAAHDVGIHYRAGTWHHAIMALDTPARFASLVWEDGGAGDCVEHVLATPVMVLPPA